MNAQMIRKSLGVKGDVVYFRNEFEQAVFRSVEGGDTFVKFKGEEEWKARPDNGLVIETLLETKKDVIDKETYDNW